MKTLIPLVCLLFFFSSCHKIISVDEAIEPALAERMIPVTRQELVSPPPPPMPKLKTTAVIKQKIIKDGNLGIKVTNLEKSKLRIDSLTKEFKGYYATEEFNNQEWDLSYKLEIRIPCDNFEHFISKVETGKNKVLYKEINARDVTDDFIDLEARILNKKAYLNRYKDLLKKAQNVKEILDIEDKIRVIEEEIDSTTGRLKYLGDQVEYSTLDLMIAEETEYKYEPAKRAQFTESLKQSLVKGWYGFVDLILFMFKIWPFWIVTTVLFLGWRRLRKDRKKRKDNI
ncbi:DUF4349 domain-containing protein [Saccharicrinis sp. FJH62]|uniref:DUF4349 domain-containing protein n=1 Tax=Saccharicrinis sp. FJH62 TaxID=3344657 RepID=UPI0035D518B1